MGINRGTVLDLINDVHRSGGFKDYSNYSYLFEQVDTMPESKEDAELHWIPVEQELPEEEKDVLVTVHFLGLKNSHPNGWNEHIKESYYVDIASHICGEWSSASDEYKIAPKRHKVIAWCELPEPFKGVTE